MSDLFASPKKSTKHMTQAQILSVGNWLIQNRDRVQQLTMKETAKAIYDSLGDQFSADQLSRLCGSLGVGHRQPERRSDTSTSLATLVQELRQRVRRLEGTLQFAEHRIRAIQQSLHGLKQGEVADDR